MVDNDNIVALATAAGTGAIAIIRISGSEAISIGNSVFQSIKGKDLSTQKSHTLHLGHIIDNNKTLDEVLVSVFRAPNSYTGENSIEISCHGSSYIQQQIIQLLIRKGCRMAHPGEFTLRSFLNGKIDLSQAEAVADLISSDNEATHQVAIQQMRGGFSNELSHLRQELMNFASLIELELDFAEEDVDFADRTLFKELLLKIENVLKRLIDSFSIGNVIKNGIPIAIVGEPNAGKSTLLNALLNEEKAIVSEIAGTTRDAIEDEIVIEGIAFRFIDTAGIRETSDIVENIGIKKTFEKIALSQVVLYLVDGFSLKNKAAIDNLDLEIKKLKLQNSLKTILVVVTKTDKLILAEKDKINIYLNEITINGSSNFENIIFLSAKEPHGTEILKNKLLSLFNLGALRNGDTIITNTRHYSSLVKALEEIVKVKFDLATNLSSDLMAIDIREALYHFGTITGEVTNDELLGNIFANFCIGK